MAKADALAKGGRPATDRADQGGADDGTRRTEILQTAASLIASSGLRTSLQEIADAAGILPGSLYHHFESKEAILVELIRRYQDDLNRIGQTAQARLDEPDDRARLREDHRAWVRRSPTARCSIGPRCRCRSTRGRARIPELIKLTRQQPTAIQEAMLQTLRAGRWSGYIKPDIDLPTLADRICQTMLQVGLDVMRHNSPADQVAGLLCRIILQGLAARPPDRFGVGSVRRLHGRERGRRDVGRRQRRRSQRQGRACPRGGANGVRPQGLRGHHHPGHRVGGGPRHRHRLSGDRIQGRTPRLDHASPSAGRSRRAGSACCAPTRRPSRSWTR